MEKIGFFQWVIDYLEKNFNICITNDELKKFVWDHHIKKYNYIKLKKYFESGNVNIYYLVDYVFNWDKTFEYSEVSDLTKKHFQSIHLNWTKYVDKNNICLDNITLENIPEKKIRKLKVNFDC